MLQNVATSLLSVETLVGNIIMLIGIGVLMGGLYDLSVFGMGGYSDPNEKIDAVIKILIGAALIYFPSTLQSVSNTLFGADNPLTYEKNQTRTIYGAAKIIMQLAGIIWVAKGLLMVLHEDRGGQEQSFKAIAYIVAGSLACNMDYTVGVMNYAFSMLRLLFEKYL